MTPIQAQSLPLILEPRPHRPGQTGSARPPPSAWACCKINPPWLAPQCLVLCPPRAGRPGGARNRRLAPRSQHQVLTCAAARRCAPRPSRWPTARRGRHAGPHPGPLARGSLDLAGLNTLVLDEADRMVDMGFYDDIVAIASHCPTKRQTLLFSGHLPDNIRKLAARFLRGRVRSRPARRQPHRADLLRDQARGTPGRRRPPAGALPAGVHAGLLQHQDPQPRPGRGPEPTRRQRLALNGDLEQRERDEILISSPTTAARCWSPPTWPRADWTSRTWAPSSTST